MTSTILVVGSGRSGTTLLLRLLGAHPDVTFISRLTERWPWLTPLAGLGRVAGSEGWLRALEPDVEAIKTYERCGLGNDVIRRLGRPLAPPDVSPDAGTCLRRVADRHARWARTGWFVTKNTSNCMRLEVLREVFPSAQVVHIQRHGCAVASSLLRVRWWPDLHLWWLGKTVRQAVNEGESEAELAGRHWATQVRAVQNSLQSWPDNQVHQLRYEDLAAQPESMLPRLLASIGLPAAELPVARLGVSTSSLEAWRQHLTTSQITQVMHASDGLMEELGYVVNGPA